MVALLCCRDHLAGVCEEILDFLDKLVHLVGKEFEEEMELRVIQGTQDPVVFKDLQ